MSHQISAEELPVTVVTELSGSWGAGECKALSVEVGLGSQRVWFKIKENDKLLYQVPELEEAVRIYNNL